MRLILLFLLLIVVFGHDNYGTVGDTQSHPASRLAFPTASPNGSMNSLMDSHRPSRLSFPTSSHLDHLNTSSSNGSNDSSPSFIGSYPSPSRHNWSGTPLEGASSPITEATSIEYITMPPTTKRPLGSGEYPHIHPCIIICQIQCEERDSLQTGTFFICKQPIEMPRPSLLGFVQEDPVHACCFLLFVVFITTMAVYGSWKLYNKVIVNLMWKEIRSLRLDIMRMLREKEEREREAAWAKQMDEEERLRGDGPMALFWHINGYVLKEKPFYPPTPPKRCQSMKSVHFAKKITYYSSPIPLRRSVSLTTVLPSHRLTTSLENLHDQNVSLSPSYSLPTLNAAHASQISLNPHHFSSLHSLYDSYFPDVPCHLEAAHLEGGLACSSSSLSSLYASASSLPLA